MKCKAFVIRLSEAYLSRDEAVLNEFLSAVKLSRVLASLQNSSSTWSVLLFYEDKAGASEDRPRTQDMTLTPSEEGLYEALRAWRNEQASKEGIAPYMIAHNSWLKQMVKLGVKTKGDLLQVKGFGQWRTEKYGDDIMRIIASWESIADITHA